MLRVYFCCVSVVVCFLFWKQRFFCDCQNGQAWKTCSLAVIVLLLGQHFVDANSWKMLFHPIMFTRGCCSIGGPITSLMYTVDLTQHFCSSADYECFESSSILLLVIVLGHEKICFCIDHVSRLSVSCGFFAYTHVWKYWSSSLPIQVGLTLL